MIKEILEKDFLFKSTSALKRSGEALVKNFETSPKIRRLLEDHETDTKEIKEACEEIEQAIDREKLREAEEEDKMAFFPRDPVMSLIQSSLQEYCEIKKGEQVKDESDEIRKLNEYDQIPVTDNRLDENLKDFLINEENQKLFNDFEKADIGWANCLLAIGIRNWRKRHPFNQSPATPYQIGNKARVVLLSDWGSGLPRAQKVSKAIREELNAPDAAGRDKHVIHLGDVYYSGWASEYEKNFLPYWAVNEDEYEKFTSWSLNANHDMYSGGKGYFETLLADKRFRHQEKSSFFSLENDKWLLLGLDTGYDDNRVFDSHDLYGEQNKWAYKNLSDAKEKTGILLSHHQPFSAFEKGGEKILDKLKEPLEEKLVEAWFWGHEHRCTLYEEQMNIKHPRCIGHGGIPFQVENGVLPAGVSYEFRQGFDHLLEEWNYFGFVVLDFNDEQIDVRYIDERGHQHKNETIDSKK